MTTQLTGTAYIKEFAARLSTRPGVYRMINNAGDVLYVGKAKHLKNRVTSYTNSNGLSNRIMLMVRATCEMQVIETRSEAEALLLEANLIKKYKPRYNILLKDDKSYPYIRLSAHDYPRIVKHRGKQRKDETYFGPFSSAGSVTQTIDLLQRAFLLRPCKDNNFNHRSRPCLEYQIKRCSAPCVNYVTKDEYAQQIVLASQFLKGKNREVQDALTQQMGAYSEAMDYEKAALCRDRINMLTKIQQQQGQHKAQLDDADVIAVHNEGGHSCLQVWFFRGGQHFGNHAYFPKNTSDTAASSIIEAFVGQYYQSHPIPRTILVSDEPDSYDVLQEALSMKAGHKITLSVPLRGERKKLISHVARQAADALNLRLIQQRSELQHMANLAELLALGNTPMRIEVYDNSHISGTHAVGAMILSTPQGFDRSGYRRFTMNNSDITPGDDYAMMREMLTRRLKRLQKDDPARDKEIWPDLLLIDGGKGHYGIVKQTLDDLGIINLPFVCIAKGVDRNAGREQFFVEGKPMFQLPINDPTLHYLQRLRDEAHRFAIASHRIKRANAIKHSTLDDVPGIGATRKRALLLHFGTAKSVEEAPLQELENAPGISKKLATQIYNYFHE